MVRIVPASVTPVAHNWELRHEELAAARDLVEHLPATGFTTGVASAAAAFTTAWAGHTQAFADESGQISDGLHAVVTTYLDSEQTAVDAFRALGATLGEGSQ